MLKRSFDVVQFSTLLQRLHYREFSSVVKKMLYGLLRVRSRLACSDTASSVPSRALSVYMQSLVHLQPITRHPQYPNDCNFSFALGARVHTLLPPGFSYVLSQKQVSGLDVFKCFSVALAHVLSVSAETQFPALLTHRCPQQS